MRRLTTRRLRLSGPWLRRPELTAARDIASARELATKLYASPKLLIAPPISPPAELEEQPVLIQPGAAPCVFT